jgi:hypothetical protein
MEKGTRIAVISLVGVTLLGVTVFLVRAANKNASPVPSDVMPEQAQGTTPGTTSVPGAKVVDPGGYVANPDGTKYFKDRIINVNGQNVVDKASRFEAFDGFEIPVRRIQRTAFVNM